MASSPASQEMREPPSPAFSIASNDSSVFDDLSFDYVQDDDGNLIRTTKGKPGRQTLSTSPPTPNDSPLSKNILGPHTASESDLVPPLTRMSLTRSESAYASLPTPRESDADSHQPSVRSFHRVASGPAIPVMSTAGSSSSSLLQPKRLPKGALPRRMQDNEPLELRNKRHTDELRARLLSSTVERDIQPSYPDEKENIARTSNELPQIDDAHSARSMASRMGPPIRTSHGGVPARDAAVSARMRQLSAGSQPVRVPRLLKGSGNKHGYDRITEDELVDEGYGETYNADVADPDVPMEHAGLSFSQSGATRVKRSSSLSEVVADEHSGYSRFPTSRSRPGTSLGIHREVPQRRELEEAPMSRAEHPRYQEFERRDREQPPYPQARQSPSPTHMSNYAAQRPSYQGHRRRDSDTLRSGPGAHSGSPTAAELPQQRGSQASFTAAKHRRSPTAPEHPTTSDALYQGVSPTPANGKTWAPGDGEAERERERAQDQGREEPDKQRYKQKNRSPPAATASKAQSPPEAQPKDVLNRSTLAVNKKNYVRLDMIGKGGSSRVYRVLSPTSELYAVKRVSLDKTDDETIKGYMNEISLLKRLEGNSRIIRLIDSELRNGQGGSKGSLMLVMECGEIDFARLLAERLQEGTVDMVWTAYYWQQMLQAVDIIHEEKIVHSDLKPANFVLVKGQLKLIDFGIANAIANDTTNIQRDHTVGTLNYMSPEAIELPDGMRRLKLGRASDIWSLGCILYQMVYGFPPFQHLSFVHKMKAIPDESHIIPFPEYSSPPLPKGSPLAAPKKTKIRKDVMICMKSCLKRAHKDRMTIPELLDQDFLTMKDPVPPKPQVAHNETIITPHYMRQLIEYGMNLGRENTDRLFTSEYLDYDANRLIQELKGVIERETATASAATNSS